MSSFFRASLALFLVLLPIWGSANPLLSPDSELLAESRLVYEERIVKGEYRFVVSEIKKVNNRWRSEREKKISGSVMRYTYQLNENSNYAEMLELLERELSTPKYKTLFDCSGLDCGASNGWANHFFEIKQLYGLDTDQRYFALQVVNPKGYDSYAAVYLIQRGNRRSFLQVDIIHPSSEVLIGISTRQVTSALNGQGFMVVPNVKFTASDVVVDSETLAAIVEALKSRFGSIAIVGHDYAGKNLEQQRKQSRQYAEWLKNKLVEKGVAERRLQVYGLGSLAPAGRAGDTRLEIIVVN